MEAYTGPRSRAFNAGKDHSSSKWCIANDCEALEVELVGVRITAGDVKQRLDEDLQRACQRRRVLQLKIDDTLKAAVEPNKQYELLDFKLTDVLDKVEELKRRHLTLEMAVEEGHKIVKYNLGDARKAMDELH
ncbi:hypothetical protein H4S08_000060 [Coemansia sp. RSA 1365]|nr:hypothetical protein H4S08_000060 [Coemansia sp. RSA 1365]